MLYKILTDYEIWLIFIPKSADELFIGLWARSFLFCLLFNCLLKFGSIYINELVNTKAYVICDYVVLA